MADNVCPCCGQPRPGYYDEVAGLARLTEAQRRLFLVLAAQRGAVVSWSDMLNAIYFDDIDGGPLNARRTVHVIRCYANKKIERFGLRISSTFGVGYRLETISVAEAA